MTGTDEQRCIRCGDRLDSLEVEGIDAKKPETLCERCWRIDHQGRELPQEREQW